MKMNHANLFNHMGNAADGLEALFNYIIFRISVKEITIYLQCLIYSGNWLNWCLLEDAVVASDKINYPLPARQLSHVVAMSHRESKVRNTGSC